MNNMSMNEWHKKSANHVDETVEILDTVLLDLATMALTALYTGNSNLINETASIIKLVKKAKSTLKGEKQE